MGRRCGATRQRKSVIAVDWGTTSFRAYRVAADGQVIARHAATSGILQVPFGRFAEVLRAEIGAWLADGEKRVLLSGMVGSRQGWAEAPYLPCPAGPEDIAGALIDIPFDGAQVKLVPGLSDRDPTGTPEVMRGEETQILGVLDRIGTEGLACLPGSHSKWARIAGGRIASFQTFLSGEAFAALRSGTILGRMMTDAPIDMTAFLRGVRRGEGALLHQVFGARSLALFGELAEAETASYLSGLLIGHEIRAVLATDVAVYLIGAASLCALYAAAIQALGGTAEILAEDAAAFGLARIGATAGWR